MKLRHTIFNSIALGIAIVAGRALFSNLMSILSGHSHVAQKHPVTFFVDIIMEAATVCFLGGGGLANLLAGRLKRKPTIVMIVVSFLTCVFLPLGVWGIIELNSSRDMRRVRQETSRKSMPNNSSLQYTPEFFHRAANISWVSVVVGFIIVVLCGSTHVKPVIGPAVLIYFFILILSFVLGIVALLGVREHGKNGILIPALTGVCISGFFILATGVALLIGFAEGAAESIKKHSNAMQNAASEKTNTVSNSQ